MFGIDAEKFFILLLIGALVIGPAKLPEYAAKLGRLMRELRRMANGAQQQLREELGPGFDDVQWQKLDPRQYEPRRIIREALTGDDTVTAPARPPLPQKPPPVRSVERLVPGTEAPFDLEAT
ncbi:twin-arginine translocase TatA/TatE family subunit [bacterium RCC_150]